MVSDIALNLQPLRVDQHPLVIDIELTIPAIKFTVLNTVKSTLHDKEAVTLNGHVGIVPATDHRALRPNGMYPAQSDTLP